MKILVVVLLAVVSIAIAEDRFWGTTQGTHSGFLLFKTIFPFFL